MKFSFTTRREAELEKKNAQMEEAKFQAKLWLKTAQLMASDNSGDWLIADYIQTRLKRERLESNFDFNGGLNIDYYEAGFIHDQKLLNHLREYEFSLRARLAHIELLEKLDQVIEEVRS